MLGLPRYIKSKNKHPNTINDIRDITLKVFIMNRYILVLLAILGFTTTHHKMRADENESGSVPVNVRLYYQINKEETDRMLLEGLRQNARLPYRNEIENFNNGYYDTSLEKLTIFSATAIDINGKSHSIPLSMDAQYYAPSSNTVNNYDYRNWPSLHCETMDTDGIGSAYLTHTFSLENDEDVASYLWHFYLMDQQGEYVEVAGGDTAPSFAITEIEDPEKYAISDGCLSGVVECLYSTSDTQYRTILFPVTLELKPIILNVSNIVKHPVEEWYFYVTFDVEYRGADKLSVETEEDYSTIMTVKDYYEPLLAHPSSYPVHSLYYSWITIVVRNEYGTAEKTLEFAPEQVSIDDIMASDPDRLVEVFTLQGISVFKGKASEYEESTLSPGMYIRRWIGTDGRVQADKIMVH